MNELLLRRRNLLTRLYSQETEIETDLDGLVFRLNTSCFNDDCTVLTDSINGITFTNSESMATVNSDDTWNWINKKYVSADVTSLGLTETNANYTLLIKVKGTRELDSYARTVFAFGYNYTGVNEGKPAYTPSIALKNNNSGSLITRGSKTLSYSFDADINVTYIITCDGTNGLIYANSTTPQSIVLNSNKRILTVGNAIYSDTTDGNISSNPSPYAPIKKIEIYNRVLTNDEITSLML